jgi:hypothetical protein
MRHLRITLGLAATVCAFAVIAAPALAHEFTASASGTTKGTTEEVQTFKFGPFKITCLRAVSKGLVAAGSSKTLNDTIKFMKCSTEGKIGTHKIELQTRFVTPLVVEYHANGFVETGSETVEEEGSAKLAGGEVQLKVSAGAKFKCNINWPEQTLPVRAEKNPEGEFSAATYSNEPGKLGKKFPGGQQTKLLIANNFKAISFEFEGEPCETFGKEEGPEGGKTGTYLGELPDELGVGSLEFS